MNRSSRRRFLAEVGQGMLLASVGTSLAFDLGLAPAVADDSPAALTFGKIEPLVAFLQDTPADKLLPPLVEKLKQGLDLRTLTAAGVLANARTFGGNDYIGFHTFMALAPAFAMSGELPAEQRPLPVLKVLYRNASRIQAFGGHAHEVLHPVEADHLPGDRPGGELLQAATRSGQMNTAERTFAALAHGPAGEAFNHLQYSVQDEVDVHRVVLAWRAWMSLDLTGPEYAHTLLRQSVRYCVNSEHWPKAPGQAPSPIRTLLPKLLDQHKLLTRSLGTRRAEDAWVANLGTLVANSGPDRAAEAVAAVLAEGIAPEDIGEALSLAANELVLRDPGRAVANGEKQVGSVHGDSVGVHASDAANAWRNIARVSNHRNTVASLIVGAYHTAGRAGSLHKEPYPLAEHLEKVAAKEPTPLLQELSAAIQSKDQFRAAALVQRYGELGHEARPVFDVLLRFGVSEDGALHAEKYYRTVSEEFAATRPAFRWRQLVALARVTASECGHSAPGYAQARELLKV
ncbi:MAG: hypothetical protein K8T25_17450 [Planctomycetia bacterium]|nr:hypothetical protein [Planctomycetia bacterium]